MLLKNIRHCKEVIIRHMKENNKSKMRCIFCIRQGGMFTSQHAYQVNLPMSREPKSMIWCESLTQRVYTSRASFQRKTDQKMACYFFEPPQLKLQLGPLIQPLNIKNKNFLQIYMLQFTIVNWSLQSAGRLQNGLQIHCWNADPLHLEHKM